MEHHNIYLENIESMFLNKVGEETMSRILNEKVPVDIRMKNAYVSTILFELVRRLTDNLKAVLKIAGYRHTKPISREITRIVNDYKQSHMMVMRSVLYHAIEKKSDAFVKKMAEHVKIAGQSYAQALLSMGYSYNDNIWMVLQVCYVSRSILEFILRYERGLTREIQKLVGPFITYTAEDNVFCVELLQQGRALIKLFDAPESINSPDISLSYKIFEKEVNLIDVNNLNV